MTLKDEDVENVQQYDGTDMEEPTTASEHQAHLNEYKKTLHSSLQTIIKQQFIITINYSSKLSNTIKAKSNFHLSHFNPSNPNIN